MKKIVEIVEAGTEDLRRAALPDNVLEVSIKDGSAGSVVVIFDDESDAIVDIPEGKRLRVSNGEVFEVI